MNVQPSELAKLALIGVLADFLANNRGRLRDIVGVALPGLGILLPLLVLVVFQRDFGTTLILLSLAGVLFLVAGMQWGIFLTAAQGGVLLLIALVYAEPYRLARIQSFFRPYADRGGGGYQVVQGWIALATGGLMEAGSQRALRSVGSYPKRTRT